MSELLGGTVITEHRFKIGQFVHYCAKWRVSIDTVSGLYQYHQTIPAAQREFDRHDG